MGEIPKLLELERTEENVILRWQDGSEHTIHGEMFAIIVHAQNVLLIAMMKIVLLNYDGWLNHIFLRSQLYAQ